MAGKGVGRSLVIGVNADTRGFGKNLSKAEKDLAKFKNGVGKLGKMVTAGFAAMGAAAIAFGKSAVEAAIEDSQSQQQLARTIKNNVKSHHDLTKAMEKSITKIQLASGVSDTKLRKSFGKLVVTTKSVTKSQKLMRTALNVSAGTGKDLETVVQALSKAYLGNNGALGRLGTGLSKAELKAMSFTQVQDRLDKTFRGASSTAANSQAGKLERLKQAYGEIVESVGYALLPTLKKVADWIMNTGLKNIQSFVGVFTGDKGMNDALKDGTSKAYQWGVKVKNAIGWIIDHKDQLVSFAKVLAGLWAVGKIAAWTSTVLGAIDALILRYGKLTGAANLAAAAESRALGGGVFGKLGKVLKFGGGAAAAYGTVAVLGYQQYDKAMRDTKNSGMAALALRIGALQMQRQTPAVKKEITKLKAAETKITNITVNGALDSKQVAKQIAQILQDAGLATGTVKTTGKVTP